MRAGNGQGGHSRSWMRVLTIAGSLLTVPVTGAAQSGHDRVDGGDVAGEPGEYRVIAAFRRGTIERELNEAAAEGFRFHSMTGIQGEPLGEVVAVMRQSVPDTEAWSYRVVIDGRAATLECELNNAARQGFVLREHVKRNGEVVAVLERHETDQDQGRALLDANPSVGCPD